MILSKIEYTCKYLPDLIKDDYPESNFKLPLNRRVFFRCRDVLYDYHHGSVNLVKSNKEYSQKNVISNLTAMASSKDSFAAWDSEEIIQYSPVFLPIVKYIDNLLSLQYPVSIYFESYKELNHPIMIKYKDIITSDICDESILISPNSKDRPDILYARHFNTNLFEEYSGRFMNPYDI